MNPERGTRNAGSRPAPLILTCFAVRQEAAHFQPAASNPLLITGIGPRNAEHSLQSALTRQRPSLVLTCGFAGGLNPELQRGDIVFNATDAEWLTVPLQRLGARPAKFHCSERIAVTTAGKRHLRLRTGADVVEMESGIISLRCREQGIPAATIRVISDDAATDLPLDFNALAKTDGNISYSRLSLALLSSPATIPKLIRFQRELDACAKRLGRLLAELMRGSLQATP
jgi:hypothetical protein